MAEQFKCARAGCDKPATKMCPTCISLGIPVCHFCSQECLKLAWKDHKKYHEEELNKMYLCLIVITSRMPPAFHGYAFTGSLRPGKVSPMMKVPDHIKKPEYAETGHSLGEENEGNGIEYKTEADIKGIRAACKVGREVLDIASSYIKPGVTTDEIDVVVFNECIKRNAYPSPLNYYFFPKSVCTYYLLINIIVDQ